VLLQPLQQWLERDMWLEVFVLQRVRSIDATAIHAGTNQHQRLIQIRRQATAVPALPFTSEVQRRSASEDFLHLAAPAALHEVIRRGDAAAQELLQLVALQLGGRA